jgi:hypothetical protein
MNLTRLALPFAVILAACSSSTTGGSGGADASAPLTACDPLAPPATTLGTVLGAGKDDAGTIYLADPRVFLTQGGKLVRQHVVGSGNGGGDYNWMFQPADSDGSDVRDLLLTVQGGKPTAMALGTDGKCMLSQGCPNTTPLTLVDPSAVAGMAIVNLPGLARYVGDAENGEVIAVTSPMENESGTAEYRIFYGPASGVREGVITSWDQALSGHPTIGFTLDGASYSLEISTVFPDGGSALGEPGPAWLELPGGSSVGVTLRLPAPKTLAGMSFLCR